MPRSYTHRPLPAQEYLVELFRYCPETGALYWRRRHNSQIDLAKPAGWGQGDGYHGMRVDNTQYKRHRLVWCYFNGDPGQMEIDHINGIRADDRIENLRPASRHQNMWNRPTPKTNKYGFRGVRPAQSGRWMAQIQCNGARKHLGTFDTAEEAYSAYLQASQQVRGNFCYALTHENLQ